MTLRIVDLVNETLHAREIVHTNLNPQEIFLRGRSVEDLCFQNLFFCQWDAKKLLPFRALQTSASEKVLPNEHENLSCFNTKIRNKEYIAPEQVAHGHKLDDLLAPKNGRLVNLDDQGRTTFAPEVMEFYQSCREKISR